MKRRDARRDEWADLLLGVIVAQLVFRARGIRRTWKKAASLVALDAQILKVEALDDGQMLVTYEEKGPRHA